MAQQLITIRQIECFLMLTKTLNFSRAAEKLYISQPTFSRQIHNLEENLGVKLFYYHGKRYSCRRPAPICRWNLSI